LTIHEVRGHIGATTSTRDIVSRGFIEISALRYLNRKARCQVCRHDERWRIELLRAGGASLDSLAGKFGLDRDAIWRHWQNHVEPKAKTGYLCGPAELATLAEKAAKEGDSILDYLKMCRVVLTGQLAAMSEAGDARGAAYVAGQLTRTLEAIGRATGEIGELARSTINVTNNNLFLSSPNLPRCRQRCCAPLRRSLRRVRPWWPLCVTSSRKMRQPSPPPG
jgi:hypothetical protein